MTALSRTTIQILVLLLPFFVLTLRGSSNYLAISVKRLPTSEKVALIRNRFRRLSRRVIIAVTLFPGSCVILFFTKDYLLEALSADFVTSTRAVLSILFGTSSVWVSFFTVGEIVFFATSSLSILAMMVALLVNIVDYVRFIRRITIPKKAKYYENPCFYDGDLYLILNQFRN